MDSRWTPAAFHAKRADSFVDRRAQRPRDFVIEPSAVRDSDERNPREAVLPTVSSS
jgi:hypothetical protein